VRILSFVSLRGAQRERTRNHWQHADTITSSSLESFRTLSCHDGQFRAWPRAAVPVPLADSELQVSLRSASRRSLTRADSGPYCQLQLRTWPGPARLVAPVSEPATATCPGVVRVRVRRVGVTTLRAFKFPPLLRAGAQAWARADHEPERGLTGPFGAAPLKKAPRRARAYYGTKRCPLPATLDRSCLGAY
jgi:hypothetical protein